MAAGDPPSLKAVGRQAPDEQHSKQDDRTGIPVFNAPGANSAAVKELVIAGSSWRRQICEAGFAKNLEGSDDEQRWRPEEELPATSFLATAGVVGLGAIGRLVANSAVGLGMNVCGYDPGLTVEGAWLLSSAVKKARSLDEVFRSADFLTVHVPLSDATRKLVNAEKLAVMKKGAVILNFAREGIVDDQAVVDAIDAGKVHAYINDFPTNLTKNHRRCVTLPHLGASTEEAEDNCAIMAPIR
jgi:D-3-phosphoglycerate dehydrogenase